MGKTCQYRSQEEERKDFHVFRNKGKDINFKKKVMPTLFDEAGEASVKDENGLVAEVSESKTSKKRRKKRKKKQQGQTSAEEPAMKKIKAVTAEEKVGKAGETKKKRNKKKTAGPVRTGAIKVQKIAGFF